MENRKVLLSVKDLEVKFRVRGRILTAIRGISLDIYENESIAIVGESGSGKSVFTKTFAGMLDSNGFISNGSIVFDDDELSETVAPKGAVSNRIINHAFSKLNEYAKLALGAETYKAILNLEAEKRAKGTLSDEDDAAFEERLSAAKFERTEAFNLKQTFDTSKEKDKIKECSNKIAACDAEIKKIEAEKAAAIKAHKAALASDKAYLADYQKKLGELKAKRGGEIKGEISEEAKALNAVISKEIYLTVARYDYRHRTQLVSKLLKAFKEAFTLGVDLKSDAQLNLIFDEVALRVKYISEDEKTYVGRCVLNLAKIRYSKDWDKIRGRKIATVFQDPMTSLNPILTIGKQITSIIIKHQGCSEVEARKQALILMKKVGIPNAENRFDDYPFQYSGGMRQRIVIAIALSCRPKILICDEPTTALDVTIQAQILKLIKDLQKEFNYTIVFITHDLGVVANVADRVAVLYAGQVIELCTVEDVFYDPRHPYTRALLSSLPQLAQKNTKLYSITGTPPSLYNKIVGDAFAPRNPYCLKIDTLAEPPMFKVSDTHYAKTWLLDPRTPHIEKPEIIDDIHGKLIESFNIGGADCE